MTSSRSDKYLHLKMFEVNMRATWHPDTKSRIPTCLLSFLYRLPFFGKPANFIIARSEVVS